METIAWLTAAIACPVAMGATMLVMSRWNVVRRDQRALPARPRDRAVYDDPEKRLALLQAEQALVEAQIRSMDDDSRGR